MAKSQEGQSQHVKKLLTLVGTVALMVVVAEGAAQIWLAMTGRSLPEAGLPYVPVEGMPTEFDPEVGVRLVANFNGEAMLNPVKPRFHLEINKQGFRSSKDYEPYIPGSDQPRNIILLGDSMVFGLYAEQEVIFSEVLNREQDDYVFINTGLAGYSTAHEYHLLKQIIDEYDPVAVFLLYTQSNDTLRNIRPSAGTPSYQMVGGRLEHTPPLGVSRPGFLHRYSALYMFAKVRFGGRDLEYVWRRAGLALWGENAYAWRVTDGILGLFQQLIAGRDLRMVVMDIPTPNQISGRLASRERQRLLRGTSEALGFEYVDLEQVYAKAESGIDSLFIENDTHWNKAGHRLIANEIMRIMREGPLEADTPSRGASD